MTEETRGHSFDELAKGLANGEVSRRKALRLMGAALVGGALASIPGVAWGAARTPPTGKGGCAPGRTLCRGKCYDLQLDRNNCGQCGNVCAETQRCVSGTCAGPPGAACTSNAQCFSDTGGIVECQNGVCTPVCPPDNQCARACCPGEGQNYECCDSPSDTCRFAGTSSVVCVPSIQ